MAATVKDADITVTTATRTEEQSRAALGVSKPEPTEAEKAATAKAEADQKAADDKAATEEAESPKPDADVSEAARTLRRNRADARKAKIQGEIDALTKRKGDEQRELDAVLARKKAALEPPAPVAPVAPAKPEAQAPVFAFQTWEQYQVQHPDAEYTEYVDARTDARHKWNTDVADFTRRQADERAAEEKRKADEASATTAAHQAETDAIATYSTAATSFAATHADYKETTDKVNFGALGWGEGRVAHLRALILREGQNGPALLYHLATHPDDLARLGPEAIAQDHEAFVATFGELRHAAKTASTPTGDPPAAPVAPVSGASPAIREPAKPKPAAPAPMGTIPGTASNTRSPAQIAEDTDDADEYIASRRAQQKRERTG